jgi:hypothetical protein
MESKNTKKDLYLQKRVALSELSRDAESLRDLKTKEAKSDNEALFWATRTINYMLLNHMYETGGATEFNTFNQWKEKGATVKKGSKAYSIWGQPVHEQKKEKQEEGNSELDKYKYFPICYLFSNLQVLTNDERTKPEEQKEPEKKEVQTLEPMVI